LSDEERIENAVVAARDMDYRLMVHEVPNPTPAIRYVVSAHRRSGGAAQKLSYAASAVEAFETGLEIVRAHVQRNEPWPKFP
jgi:hypothetical protein